MILLVSISYYPQKLQIIDCFSQMYKEVFKMRYIFYRYYLFSTVNTCCKLTVFVNRYGRVEPMSLGKFAVNITKCPAAGEPTLLAIPNEIAKFFELVTTKVR